MLKNPEPGIPQPRKVKWIIAGACLALIVLSAFSARPAWHLIKEWRATKLAEQAQTELSNDSLEDAWEKAQSAYALYSNNEEVARTAAIVTMRFDPAMAVELWEQAYELSGKSEDLEKLVDAAIQGRQLKKAEEYLEKLSAIAPQKGHTYLLEAQLGLAQRDIEKATEAARKAIAVPNPPEEAHFIYVQLTQFAEQPALRQEGVDYLRSLARQPDELGLKALRNLGSYSANTPEELEQIIRSLKTHPLSKRSDQLLALKLAMRLPDANAQTNLDEALNSFNQELPEDLIELGRWLNQQGRYTQTLELIDEQTARSRKDLFLIWMDALAVLDQWDIIGKLLADNSTPIENYLRLLFQARLYMETGQSERAEFAWSRAVLQVANDRAKLWFLTSYARRLGLITEAKQALDRLTKLPSSRREAFEELVKLEQLNGTARDLRDRLKAMHEAYPKDLAVQNDLAYANLLLGENIEESLQIAENLIENQSPYLANRITLALAYYKLGRMQEAAAVLDPLSVDWSQTRSGFRAVYAAILRANGRNAEANTLLGDISVESLLPEERALLGKNES